MINWKKFLLGFVVSTLVCGALFWFLRSDVSDTSLLGGEILSEKPILVDPDPLVFSSFASPAEPFVAPDSQVMSNEIRSAYSRLLKGENSVRSVNCFVNTLVHNNPAPSNVVIEQDIVPVAAICGVSYDSVASLIETLNTLESEDLVVDDNEVAIESSETQGSGDELTEESNQENEQLEEPSVAVPLEGESNE